MTIQQLKYIIKVAECGSISEASKQLFISQPSLSSAIKELENEFGVRIEDVVCVTDNGCENLTKSPKELIVL